MLKLIKSLLKDNSLYLAILVTICIAFLSLYKFKSIDGISIRHIDKLEHFIAYFVLTVLWLFSIKNTKYQFIIVIGCVGYGLLMEFLQKTLTSYRVAEFNDVIANILGVLFGLLGFKVLFNKKKQKI